MATLNVYEKNKLPKINLVNKTKCNYYLTDIKTTDINSYDFISQYSDDKLNYLELYGSLNSDGSLFYSAICDCDTSLPIYYGFNNLNHQTVLDGYFVDTLVLSDTTGIFTANVKFHTNPINKRIIFYNGPNIENNFIRSNIITTETLEQKITFVFVNDSQSAPGVDFTNVFFLLT